MQDLSRLGAADPRWFFSDEIFQGSCQMPMLDLHLLWTGTAQDLHGSLDCQSSFAPLLLFRESVLRHPYPALVVCGLLAVHVQVATR
jgi:hypothetical protein